MKKYSLLKILKLFLSFLYLLGHPFFILFIWIIRKFFQLELFLKKIFQRKPFSINFCSLISHRVIIYFFLLFFLFFIIWDLIYFNKFLNSLPKVKNLKSRNIPLTTKIYDRNSVLLYKIYNQKENRTLIGLDKIPDHLIKATLSIEDKDFFRHGAFSLSGMLRAIRQNLSGNRQGGSTITQQLVKNVFLSSEPTLQRKFQELILSFQTEMIYSKDEILTMYFNEVSYGGTAYGVEEASQTYFGKPVVSLSLAESALLAGLPAAPTFYSPFGIDPKRSISRQKEVLRRMQEDGYISKEEKLKAMKEKISFISPRFNLKAPHFVMYLKDLLVKMYGEKKVEQGGLKIISSLNYSLQKKVEQILIKGIVTQKYLNVSNGAVLITTPENGEIITMLGSLDYFDFQNDGNVNVVLMPRQPGSVIKPINYAAALTLGKITPASFIMDTPQTYLYNNAPSYAPQNYDRRYRGKITVRQALASSLNIPAVRILHSYGVDQMIEFGKLLGITTWNDKKRFGLSLTLGGGEVTMLDLAKSYGVFANLGKKIDLSPLLEVYDHQGNLLYSKNKKLDSPQVLPTGVAFLLNDILADNNARSLVFGLNSVLNTSPFPVSVKTGTTENKKDNWTIGYNKDFLNLVWIGNNNSAPMSPSLESGVSGAAPIWRKITDLLLEKKKPYLPSPPSDLVKIEICKDTGLPSCGNCQKISEYFLKGTEPYSFCKPSFSKNP